MRLVEYGVDWVVVCDGWGKGSCSGFGLACCENGINQGWGVVVWIETGGRCDGGGESILKKELVERSGWSEEIQVQISNDSDGGGGRLGMDMIENVLEVWEEVWVGWWSAIKADDGMDWLGFGFCFMNLDDDGRGVWDGDVFEDGDMEAGVVVNGCVLVVYADEILDWEEWLGDILRDVVLSKRDNVRQLVEMIEMLGEGVKISIYGADIGMIEGECSTAERNGLTVNSAEVWVNQVLWRGWAGWRWARRRLILRWRL